MASDASTPAQLEARRLAAGRLLRAGRLSQAEIARAFGISRAAVSHWSRHLARAGLAGLRRPHSGRPSRLSAVQWRHLGTQLRRGAPAHGFPTEQWTLRRIAQLIQRCYRMRYHPRYLERPLQRHGFTMPRPVAQAKERDEALVRAWLKHDWELVKKGSPRVLDHCLRGGDGSHVSDLLEHHVGAGGAVVRRYMRPAGIEHEAVQLRC